MYFTPAKLSSAGKAKRLKVLFGLNEEEEEEEEESDTSKVALEGRSSSLTARKPPP